MSFNMANVHFFRFHSTRQTTTFTKYAHEILTAPAPILDVLTYDGFCPY